MSTRAYAGPFETITCSAPEERSARMRDFVLRYVPRDRAITMVEIGCGTGVLAFRLADALPLASIAAIDVSPANIQAAEAQRATQPSAGRVSFRVADYLEYRTAPADVLVTDTVLHFLRSEPPALWTKLSQDLRPGGILVCCMGYECAYNRSITLARRLLRRLRSTALDSVILFWGRALHGRTLDRARLRERMEYMYIPPEQLLSRTIVDHLTPPLGLELVAEHDVPSTSASELRQRLTVFRKHPMEQSRD